MDAEIPVSKYSGNKDIQFHLQIPEFFTENFYKKGFTQSTSNIWIYIQINKTDISTFISSDTQEC